MIPPQFQAIVMHRPSGMAIGEYTCEWRSNSPHL